MRTEALGEGERKCQVPPTASFSSFLLFPYHPASDGVIARCMSASKLFLSRLISENERERARDGEDREKEGKKKKKEKVKKKKPRRKKKSNLKFFLGGQHAAPSGFGRPHCGLPLPPYCCCGSQQSSSSWTRRRSEERSGGDFDSSAAASTGLVGLLYFRFRFLVSRFFPARRRLPGPGPLPPDPGLSGPRIPREERQVPGSGPQGRPRRPQHDRGAAEGARALEALRRLPRPAAVHRQRREAVAARAAAAAAGRRRRGRKERLREEEPSQASLHRRRRRQRRGFSGGGPGRGTSRVEARPDRRAAQAVRRGLRRREEGG